MKNFEKRKYSVKKLSQEITDLQKEIDFLEIKRRKINNILNDESRIIINLGLLKELISENSQLHNGLYINHLHRFSNDDSIKFINGKIFIGGYENNDYYRNDDVNVAVIINFNCDDKDIYDIIIKFA